MRVLHVIPSVASRRGGPSRVVLDLARAQAARGARVRVLALDADLAPGEDEEARVALGPSVELSIARRVGPARLDLSVDLVRPLLVSVRDADVVHSHTIYTFPVAAAPLLARALGVASVVRPAGTLDEACRRSRSARRKALAVAAYVRPILRGADAVQATSELEARDLAELAPGARVVVVEPGVEVADVRADAGGRGSRVGFLGRLHPIKRVEALLEATARLPPDVELVVAGEGEAGYVATLRARARALGIEGRVRWLGHVDAAARRALLEGCDVLACTSEHESFGLAVAEAMAAGRAVAVTPGVALAEVVARVGAGRVSEADPAALAAAIAALLDDGSARARAAEAGRTYAARELGMASAHARIERLYDDVLARRRART